jgi:hypothetical protein
LIETQTKRNGVGAAHIHRGTARRREILRFLMADVGFRRLQGASLLADAATKATKDNNESRSSVSLLPPEQNRVTKEDDTERPLQNE